MPCKKQYKRMTTLLVKSNTMSTTERVLGQVKWFNNKAGYGFITLSSEDADAQGKDIFVHYSSIRVTNSQYKFLTQGEYVEFSISNTQTGSHEFQAANVGGIKSGQLMCETRNEFKLARTNYKTTKTSSSVDQSESGDLTPKTPRQSRVATNTKQPKTRGEGPREGDGSAWTLVAGEKRDTAAKKTRAPRKTTKTAESI
jgi:cold shock CspA family protein